MTAAGRARFAVAGPLASIQAIEVLTGIGLTLLGSMLPALAALWHLDDGRSGSLLLAVFAGSALGAVLVRAPFSRSLAAGLALMAISMAALALCRVHFLFALLLVFGIGLGLAMTSNSLIIGQRFQRRRAAMLTLLNFSWSAGAALCPFAVQWIIHHAGIPAVFWTLAAASAIAVPVALRLFAGTGEPQPAAAPAVMPHAARVVAFFATFTMLYCGAEAALGGWVLTYVHRLGFHTVVAPPLATSCFWLSLLVGRAVAPAILLRIREERVLAVALVGAFAGVVALLMLRTLPTVLLAATVAGFSMAPIFPICVSIFLTLARDAAQARWLFAIAGVGSSSLPWLTGVVAQQAGSLHVGLLVPLVALGLMLVMLRWPGGGTELFRRLFHARERDEQGSSALSST